MHASERHFCGIYDRSQADLMLGFPYHISNPPFFTCIPDLSSYFSVAIFLVR